MNEAEASPRVLRILAIVGGIALMTAMAVDVTAVIMRQIGWRLFGSIELVQAAVVISAATGMVLATVYRTHAIVHVVVENLSDRPKRIMLRVANLFAALMFAALATGIGWTVLLHWGDFEQSELLGIPYTPLRIILTVACATIAVIFTWHAIQGDRK